MHIRFFAVTPGSIVQPAKVPEQQIHFVFWFLVHFTQNIVILRTQSPLILAVKPSQ